jgi:putative tryptophan/tyrosine transport system substrate-binding protein
MRRRDFITLLGSGAATWPLVAHAQQPGKPVIGFLGTASANGYDAFLASFRDGLKAAGFVEGRDATIEYRWAEGHIDRLPALAADLVSRRVAVIVASGGDAPGLAAKQATDQIPIIFMSGGEPVKAGLVKSLNRPGGNITGVNFIVSELIPKRLEILHELAPKARTVGALVNPSYPAVELQRQELREAAAARALQIRIVSAGVEQDLEQAITGLKEQGSDMLFIANDPFFQGYRDLIIRLAARYNLPASYPGREFVEAGGLFSYGPDLSEVYRLGGSYVGKILNGAKPANLPVQLPTKFDFAVNLKTAKTLGLSIPQILLATADEVIE